MQSTSLVIRERVILAWYAPRTHGFDGPTVQIPDERAIGGVVYYKPNII
jgi:hypothetical protein